MIHAMVAPDRLQRCDKVCRMMGSEPVRVRGLLADKEIGHRRRDASISLRIGAERAQPGHGTDQAGGALILKRVERARFALASATGAGWPRMPVKTVPTFIGLRAVR